tara:strand:- start:172 stop:1386 length:1215 start_codon:yes stop_codon:yes gene_type:complete
MKEGYKPSDEILKKYADVVVNFALWKGKGMKKGDTVLIRMAECAKPFLLPLIKAILKEGGNPIVMYTPDGISAETFEAMNEDQVSFFPEKFVKGMVDEFDHMIAIEAEADPHELESVDPKKMMAKQKAYAPYLEWRRVRENKEEFSWTIVLYGTEGMAKEADMSLREYWDEIIKACYLDEKDPVKKWNDISEEIRRVKDKLNDLEIEKVRIEAEGTDLWVGLGENRQWLGGTGQNVPSFEVFISPHAEMTEGHITFTEPLYRYGNLIDGVYLEFKDGKVVKSSAKKGEKVLKEMIATPGADKIGEFSLTDSRLSRIDKFMATTLFDENTSGKKGHGNTHLALGNAYQDSYSGDLEKVSKAKWKEMGYNKSVIHTDIVATSDRKVTATLKDGKEKVIYEKGQFLI